MTQEELVILVNKDDKEQGTMEKMEAHQKGVLHRAISVFIVNPERNAMMLQRRALTKYHSAGLWTNAACSHPRPGESNEAAANRRLKEEMGLETSLKKIHHFKYKAFLDNELTEHEFDHVFLGVTDQEPVINPDEVDSWQWMDLIELKKDINYHPERYTIWFKVVFDEVEQFVRYKMNNLEI